MLTREGSLDRQKRFREELIELKLDAAIITDPLDVYYLTGVLLNEKHPVALTLGSDGRTWVLASSDESAQCADEWDTFDWNIGYSINPDMVRGAAKVLTDQLRKWGPVKRLGWQAESMSKAFADTIQDALNPGEWVSCDDALQDQQKRVDSDELACLREANRIDLAAYDAAQKAIVPGANELEVLAAAQEAAMLAGGEKIYHDGDYQCGEFGGFARNRVIEKGEFYIIDAWVIYHGYWSDLCRAWVVGGDPTDLQRSVYEHIAGLHRDFIPNLLKPGMDGKEVWSAVDEKLREHPALKEDGLIHHAGHACHLRPHRMPDLNSDRGGTLEVGNILCVEPGGYTPELRKGIRLENTYYLGPDGVENLSDYPFDPVPLSEK